jgi:hypothetical protein
MLVNFIKAMFAALLLAILSILPVIAIGTLIAIFLSTVIYVMRAMI